MCAALLSSPLAAAENPITISGAAEVEANMSEDYAGASTADIVVATAAFVVDAQINDSVSAHLAFLYEEDAAAFDGSTFVLDEATVTLQFNTATSLSAGRMYVPFGSFESNMVSDPLTLDLGETSETAIMVGMESSNISGSLYTFNGDTDETSATDNGALSFGGNITYSTDTLWMGAGYISNIADSDGIQDDSVPFTVDSAVAGMGVNFGMKINSFTLLVEHVAAMESFTNGDLGGGVTNEETPTASNVEAAFLGLPETATSVAVSFDVMEGAGVGVEYRTSEDYAGDDDSTFTLQLAVEF